MRDAFRSFVRPIQFSNAADETKTADQLLDATDGEKTQFAGNWTYHDPSVERYFSNAPQLNQVSGGQEFASGGSVVGSSTVVASSEAAMALTPIALIPQVVLGGLMVPMTTVPHLRPLMYIIPARWGFEGAIAPERSAIAEDPAWVIDLHRTDSIPAEFIEGGKFKCAIAQMAADNFGDAPADAHVDFVEDQRRNPAGAGGDDLQGEADTR